MSDFEIDPNALDHECIRQPTLIHMYGLRLAKAKKAHKDAVDGFDIYKNKTMQRIRDRPERFKIIKLTEGAADAALKASEGYESLKAEVTKQEYEVDLAWVCVHATNAKQRSLTDLVKLHGQQYFSQVPVTEEGVKSIQRDTARRKGAKGRTKDDD